jgi:hypothetical protein
MNPLSGRIRSGVWSRALLFLLTLPLLRCDGPPAEPAPVALALSPDHPRIAEGTGQGFALRATFADGKIQDVSQKVQWSVVDASGRPAATATVLPGPLPGLIAVENPGHYRVRATLGGKVLETTLEVTAATLTSVAISPTTPAIALGTQQQFTLTGKFSDGTTQDVTALSAWSLKNLVGTGVAVIDSTGLATSKAVGKVTVSGRYKTKTSSTTLEVTPAVVTTIGVMPSMPSIAKGTSVQFTARAVFSDGTVQDVTSLAGWSVRDVVGTRVAEIDASGHALGRSEGQVEVSADYSGQIASTVMTVTPAVATSLQVAPGSASIALGTSQQFTATASFSDGSTQDVTRAAAWTESDLSGTGVASVSASGNATSKAVGLAQITATYSGLSSSASLTVGPAVLTSMTVSPAMATIGLGSSQAYTASGTFSDGTVQDLSGTASWSVTDLLGSGVASVTARGNVTAKAVGTARISASYRTATATAVLVVVPPTIVSLLMVPNSATIGRGMHQPFQAMGILSDGTAQDVSSLAMWCATDLVGTGVASVDATGVATGNALGQASINAVYKGFTATALLTVSSLSVTPVPTTQTLWGIWGSSASDVWVAGVGGVILHYDGTKWTTPTALAGSTNVNAVWGSGANDVWFGGNGGLLIHWNGSTFSMSSMVGAPNVYDLWGTSSSDIWAAATNGAYHYDGSSWSLKASSTASMNAAWGSSSSDVWLLGSSTNLHWNGTSMETPVLPSASIWSVAGSGAHDVWAVGTSGTILHYNGTSWTSVPSMTTVWLVGVSVASANDVLITGYTGTILKWDGSSLTSITSPTSQNLMRSLRIGGRTFITGWNGTLLD